MERIRIVMSAREQRRNCRRARHTWRKRRGSAIRASWAWAPATGEIRYWSEECYRVLGFDQHGGHPRFDTFFQRTHPEDRAKWQEATDRAIDEKFSNTG